MAAKKGSAENEVPPHEDLTVTREQLIQTILELNQATIALQEQNKMLLEVAKAKVAEATKPLVVLQGSFSVDQAEKLTTLVRDLGGDGVVALVAHGNSIFALSEDELLNLGLMRIGVGH